MPLPPGTRPRLNSSRSPQTLERACCLKKTCQWPTSRLIPGDHPCPSPEVSHRNAHGCPSPHETSALLVHSVPFRLVKEPLSPRVSMLPWKNMPVANVATHPGELTHASCLTLPIKRHTDAPSPMQRVPFLGFLWAYRTGHGRPTGNTHFSLEYGMDAVIPTEIGLPMIRTAVQGQKDENLELERNLNWANEVRENASIRMVTYQQRAAAHYNCKARP